MKTTGAALLIALYAGIADAQDDWGEDVWAEETEAGVEVHGFVEGAHGERLHRNPVLGSQDTLSELRLRAETEWLAETFTLRFKGDAWYDRVTSELELKAREFSLSARPWADADLKAGRQVLTWGTGDFLFLNDLFPKDFQAFFSGLDDEYLKAPSDTVKLGLFTDIANLDLAWTPVFEPDRYLNGERFSFFSPLAGQVVAPDPPLRADRPARQLENGELAARIYRNINGNELAAYLYRGYFPTPSGLNNGRPFFPRMNAYGASLRRPLAGGLFNTEFAWYDSPQDRDGDDPLLPNSELRFLAGYERELLPRFTAAGQFYVEWIDEYDALRRNSPNPAIEREQWRTLLTTRLTWRSPRDRYTGSLFAFYSPTEHDWHLRPRIEFRHSDQWTLAAGLNLFEGRDAQTFFGQLEDNDNAWIRIRYNY